MDFKSIKRVHVLAALNRLRRGEVPAGFKPSKDYDVKVGVERFAPKQVVAFAHEAATGTLPRPSDFEGGAETSAFRVLTRCQVQVVRKAGSRRSWIFQGNPKMFRIDEYLEFRSEVVWSVNQHKQEIEPGDRVYLWRSGAAAGVIAIGRVISSVQPLPDDVPELWIGPTRKNSGLADRVRVQIIKRQKPVLSRERVMELLPELAFFRKSQGTNFPISEREANILDEGLGTDIVELQADLGVPIAILEALSPDDLLSLSGPVIQGKEGRVSLYSHYVRERNVAVARDAKRQFKSKHKVLSCEACGLVPSVQYGVEIIEAHHKVPLSLSKGEREISASDFLMLCPSCHRAIHKMADCSFEALLETLKNHRAKSKMSH
jgi:hypothetical protein